MSNPLQPSERDMLLMLLGAAAFAALMRVASTVSTTRWRLALADFCASLFAGFVTGLIAVSLDAASITCIIATCVGSWGGRQVLDAIVSHYKQTLTVSPMRRGAGAQKVSAQADRQEEEDTRT